MPISNYDQADPQMNLQAQALNGGTGSSGETLTTNTPDPFRELLLGLIQSQAASTSGQVPASTMQSIEQLTKNPAVAAEYFPQLAKPLLEANRVSQERQTTGFTDTLRKLGVGGGAMQSGAAVQGARQLAGDFARQDQEILAKNYVPLTSQLSENTIAAQKAGLAVPEAQAATYRNLVPLATGLQPLKTLTQQTGVNQPISAPAGQTAGQQAAQIAGMVQQYSNLQPESQYYR
jgi:hypothetical protein